MWEVGSEPQFLTPLPPPRWPGRRIPKTLKLLLYSSLQSSRGPTRLSCDAQAWQLVRVVALPCRQEHREINFRQKNRYDLEDVFSCFLPNGARRLVFTMIYHLRDDHFFSILTPKWPNPTSGPRGSLRDQWDPIGTQFDQIWIQFEPNWANLDQLGPIYSQTPDQPHQRTLG